MLLYGQDHRVLRGHKGMVFDGLDDVNEPDFGGQCAAVINDGIAIWPLPAVHCGGEGDNGRGQDRK